jgi:monoamine oxidase
MPCQFFKQTSDETVVTCTNGKSFACKHVVMTAPPNMIARVQFQPPLPKRQQSLFESMQMGNLTKVFVMYKDSFWYQSC